MKFNLLIWACISALQLTPALYAASSHERTGQEKAPPSHTVAANAPQMGEGASRLPLEADAVRPTAATSISFLTESAKALAVEDAAVADDVHVSPKSVHSGDGRHRGYHRDPRVFRGSGFGVASLVFGLLGITIAWIFPPFVLLFAILAIVFGGIGLGRCRSGKGMAVAGLVLGILTLALLAAVVALIALFVL
jgi:hypothetical protein